MSTFLNRNTVYSTLSGDYTYISIIFFRIQGEYTVDVVFIYRVELACYKMGMYRARDFLCKGIDICRFKRSLDNIDTLLYMKLSRFAVLQSVIIVYTIGDIAALLCSSDDEYAGFAPEAFEKLKDKAIVVVAGNPESRPELEAKGLMNYIHVKNNVLEELKGYQVKLGIK